ncbi:D-2-hydroxyacid dehydrogenase [Vibrio sp. Of7-15]|uniref:D-2-hydroxyacid dehydrogenase n=1 Tax=Vibrio sp. Of7-15 TaxID=2724879 RepID=UPI001EF1DC78|nr:D-2-hydroxyacid dehydrogenase [Vibrio sp. Of7-15]MCG7498697.1 D-2-hydroxyacid dehydrogenase [Vibrio sp. Of7-15]
MAVRSLSATPTIVFLDTATIPPHITIPRPGIEHQWQEYASTSVEELDDRLFGAEIVISNKVVLNASTLARHPHIKLIAIAATGTNNVDLDYCQANDIAVANIQGYATRSVPEHVVAMMFALKRNLLGYHQDIAQGEWQKQQQFCFFTHPIMDIAGSTLGLVGSGSLGQAVASLAKGLGMTVLFAERKGAAICREGYFPFEQVLAEADVISLHCPLTDETTNLISTNELKAMKESAVLINTGRGGLVDEAALVKALKEKEIAGAGVDVFTQEPADNSNPLLANQHLANLLLTPHVAWGSDSSIGTLLDLLMENIEAFSRGERLRRVV